MSAPDTAAATIAVIGPCSTPFCTRAARIHVEIEIAGRVIRGVVCERCDRATQLGAVLVGAEDRRLA